MIMLVGCNGQGVGKGKKRKKADTSKTIFPVAGYDKRFNTTNK